MRKMKKIAFILSMILAIEGSIPGTALLASELNNDSEAEAVSFDQAEVPEETAEEDSVSNDRADADEAGAADFQWPDDAPVLGAGTFDTIYKFHNGKGYGFSFWLDNGTKCDQYTSLIWDAKEIYYRIDGGDVQRAVQEADTNSIIPFYGENKVAFGCGYLSGSISEGDHTIDVAVKKNGSWVTGRITAGFKESSNTDEVIRNGSGVPDDPYQCFSSKEHGFILDFYLQVNASGSADSIDSIVLCDPDSGEIISNGKTGSSGYYSASNRDARYQYDDYPLRYCLPSSGNITSEVDFDIDKAVPTGWYDVVVTNSSGLKTRIRNAYYGTDQPVVYGVYSNDLLPAWLFPGVIMLPNISSSYTAAYVYGLNIPADGSVLPVYYHKGEPVSGKAEASEQNGDGWGRYFKLEKNEDPIWDKDSTLLNLQLRVQGYGIIGDTRIREVNQPYGPVVGNVGQYLLLSDDWVKGAEEVGIAGYSDGMEVFSQKCDPYRACDGGWYIHVTKTHDSYYEFIDDTYVTNNYKAYRIKNGKKELSNEFYYYFSDSGLPDINTVFQAKEELWTGFWPIYPWMEVLPKVRFEVCDIDSMDVIAAGKVEEGKSVYECITNSYDRERVRSLPFMRVLFYDNNGTLSLRSYLLGESGKVDPVDFEAVIPVKGKIALDSPDFAVSKWKSSNKSIASVSGTGVVTGKKAGKAIITATGVGASAAKEYTIYVEKPVLKNTTLYNRDSFNINKKVSGVTRLVPVSYQSSDSSVAEIDGSGNVTVKKGGKTRLTVNYGYGSVSGVFTVKLPYIKNTDLSMLEGKTKKLSKGNCSSKDVISFASSDENTATVNNSGVVTGLLPGTTEISLYINGVKYDTCIVTVKKPVIKQRAVILKNNKTAKLSIIDRGKHIAFSSDNEKVATVTKTGKIKAVGAGTAIISVSIYGKTYDTCAVTVK